MWYFPNGYCNILHYFTNVQEIGYAEEQNDKNEEKIKHDYTEEKLSIL